MKHEPLSGASAFPRRRRGRTLVEPLEARVLYSADVTTVTAPSLSPLLCGTGIAQAALLGGLASRQVEVATVQASGSVGPSVRIDIAQLAELRVDAAQRREELFQKAAERSSLLWSASDEWSTGSHGVVASGQPGQSTTSGGDESEAEALARFHSAPGDTSRIEARATLVAQAWKRVQETPSSDSDGDGDSYEVTGPVGAGGTMTAMWQAPLTIALIDHGDILLLPQPWDVDYGFGADGSGGGLFGSVTSVSQGLSTGSAATEPQAPTRFASSGTDSSGPISTTSASSQLYSSGDGSPAQQLVAGGHARASGPAGKSRSPGSRGEDDEDSRRFDSATASAASAAGTRSRPRGSVIGGDGDASLIGGEESRSLNGAGAHGPNSLNSISTTSSLLGGGAAGDASASVVLAGSNTIVVAAKGIGSVAVVEGGSWLSRAANGANFATGMMINGAWVGGHRMLDVARGVATAIEGVAAPLLPEAIDVASAAGSETADIAPVSTTGMLLGLAPVWNWGGGAAHDATLDPEMLARAWRVAAAGSLIVTLAGCWYCATVTRRAGRVRRRLADRARFATARRIRFNPRPV